MESIVLVVIIALLVLAQGGFFALSSCLLGLALCVVGGIAWLRKSHRGKDLPVIPLLFVGLALSFAVSALVNGTSLTTLSETGVWMTCAGASFLAAAQDDGKRASWMKVLVWFGIATAVFGMLEYVGVIALQGNMLGDRLQFSYQYANAAAAWYGLIAFLCLVSPDKRLRSFAILPTTAFLLTESGGAACAFALVALIAIAWCIRSSQWERLFEALVQGVLAVILFAIMRLTMSPVSLCALVAIIAACWWYEKWSPRLTHRIGERMASIVIIGILAICAITAVVLLPERIADAVASFGERMDCIRDGCALWISAPVFGVGPDNWQYLYPYIQTAPYYTTVVHCSYLQILLDAGIIGLVFLIATCVLGVRSLVCDCKQDANRGGWACAELAAVAFLLVHSALDFDLQFSSLACVLAVLISSPTGPVLHAKAAKGVVAGLLCLVICLPGCVLGLTCAAMSTAIQMAEATGDYDSCQQLVESSTLAQSDVTAQSSYLASFYGEGNNRAVTDIYWRMMAPTSRDALYTAIAYFNLGDKAQATAVLVNRLEQQPYDSGFLEGAIRLADVYGVDDLQRGRFNAAVEHSSELTRSFSRS